MLKFLCLLIVLITIPSSSSVALDEGETVYLTVSFCDTPFSSKGAVIAVNSTTAEYKVLGTFDWPSNAIFGCSENYDPTVEFDPETSLLYIDIIDDFGLMLTLDVPNVKLVQETNPGDEFFVGFTDMRYDGKKAKRMFGMSPTGTSDGRGAFQFGSMLTSARNGKYINITNIPYREMPDDTAMIDYSTYTYVTQASYDRREDSSEWCDPKDSGAQCLIHVNMTNGQLLSTVHTTYTVYKWANSPNANGTVLAFIFGDEKICKHPYEDFLFANVNLTSAEMELIACIGRDVTIQEAEWISSFSSDNKQFATASGFGSELQFLSFNSTNGSLLAQSNLDGLAKELGAYSGLVSIWAVDFKPLQKS